MQVVQRRQRVQDAQRASVAATIGARDDAEATAINVISGPYMQSFPLAGRTVSQIRELLRSRLDIDERSIAMVDGEDVGRLEGATERTEANTTVRAGQTLVFLSRFGEKGICAPR